LAGQTVRIHIAGRAQTRRLQAQIPEPVATAPGLTWYGPAVPGRAQQWSAAQRTIIEFVTTEDRHELGDEQYSAHGRTIVDFCSL